MAVIIDWVRRAACLDHDPDLFFPISFVGLSRAQVDRAKAVCGSCPVRQACLTYALDTGQQHGVWGGLEPDERRTAHKHHTIRHAA
ncbi:WhiB family transcriptional regulator [Nonomuraea sp. NPDC050663]|uniref:Transcriptional regulator WhiB n=1 Tax=Nonomuraea soli TaxID=1032476 RepID=A0A7W0HUE2_9ACTN|nr:WhiB family transcriptional regulator [Nonomuraea soli]MBA2896064.1 WhiB family redox-sensing transcriptional regulator [Nonomuraea soli]